MQKHRAGGDVCWTPEQGQRDGCLVSEVGVAGDEVAGDQPGKRVHGQSRIWSSECHIASDDGLQEA